MGSDPLERLKEFGSSIVATSHRWPVHHDVAGEADVAGLGDTASEGDL